MTTVLKMVGITKRFPKVVANENVTIELNKGEILALLGENGAGKTTLMNCLYGLYHPDEGEIFINGEKVKINCSEDAIKHGIGMVHQHFMLVPELTVTENIILGLKSRQEPFLDLKAAERVVQELSDRYHFNVNPRAKVKDLPVGIQQRVEILKTLYRKADILVLDEATAVLTPQEVEELFQIIRRLTQEGRSILIITHKLDEVMALADRVTVLRDGKVVGTVAKKDTNPKELARMMVGREVFLNFERKPCKPGDVLMKVEHLEVEDKFGVRAVKDISFELRAGEILGIAGVDGNGQIELSEAITGLLPYTNGKIYINGREQHRINPRKLLEAGVSHIPQDRHKTGLVLEFTIGENLILQEFYTPAYSKNGVLKLDAIRTHGNEMIKQYQIKATDPSVTARTLSGGNQQKVILARELNRQPKILIAVQPTRGLDIGATEFVRRKLLEQRDNGSAVLLISTELEEILSIADRIAVIHEGEFMGVIPNENVDIEEIGLMMAGTRKAS